MKVLPEIKILQRRVAGNHKGMPIGRYLAWGAAAALMMTGCASTAQVAESAPNAQTSTTRVITLGTGAGPYPRVKRAKASNALQVNGRTFLIDAGDGMLMRMAAAGIRIGDPEAVFLTHMHIDHTAALPTLLGLRVMTSITKPIDIYGPYGVTKLVNGYLDGLEGFEASRSVPSGFDPRSLPRVHEFSKSGLLYSDKDVKVYAAENSHYNELLPGSQAKSFSYRFETADRTVVFSGDTGSSDSLVKLATGADLLVVEVSDPNSGAERILRNNPNMSPEALAHHMRHILRNHLTPEEVGQLASAAKVKAVVLSHIGPGNDNDPDPFAMYVEGVQKFYSGPVTLASDLDAF